MTYLDQAIQQCANSLMDAKIKIWPKYFLSKKKKKCFSMIAYKEFMWQASSVVHQYIYARSSKRVANNVFCGQITPANYSDKGRYRNVYSQSALLKRLIRDGCYHALLSPFVLISLLCFGSILLTLVDSICDRAVLFSIYVRRRLLSCGSLFSLLCWR